MKRSIAAVMAILVLLVSLLCACKKDDTKTTADTTVEAQTSADGQIIEDTTALPEDSTAQGDETDETQSADPAKPGETSAQVTAAPSKSTKDWNKTEIIVYFNAGANRVKYGAKSVTRNYTETKNDADKTELPKAIDAIGKSAMKTFMKRDDKAIVMTSKEDIKTVFPVGGKDWVSKLTVSDVKSAKIEDKGGEYQITLIFGTEAIPRAIRAMPRRSACSPPMW